eukprot:g30440.t1
MNLTCHLSDIFVANNATAEKILEQRRQVIEEEQNRIAEELDLNRDTYEGRLQALEELSHRVETGENPAHWLDINVESEEAQPTEEEEADEVEDDQTAPVGEAETAAVAGQPEPEAPSAESELQQVMDSYVVHTQYLEDQYQEYEYCTIEVGGSLQQGVRIGDREFPLHFSSGWDLHGYHLFFAKPLKDWLTQLSKVVRQHDSSLGLVVDEEGFADIDEVARCFKLNNANAPDSTVKAVVAIAAKDSKNRFEFLGIREGSKDYLAAKRVAQRRALEEKMHLPKREWRVEELELILIGVDGEVFNVWRGRDFYGAEGPYGVFAGKDATRYFAKQIDNYFAHHVGPIGLYGVCDGHGPFGHLVSFRLVQSLPHFIASNPNWGEDWGLCLKEAFLAAQKELIEFAAREGFNLEASGAAGSVLIFEARLVKNTRRTM